MNSRSTTSHSSRRGGSRNRSERGPRSSAAPTPAPAARPTFWQKVTSLFTGRSTAKPATSLAKPTVHPANAPSRRAAERSSSAPDRSERSERTERPDRSASSAGARTSRKPEMVEVTTPRLYVGNLSFDAAENDLSELFNGVGQVVSVEVVTHKQTQRSKGFAFVQMQGVDEAKRAVLELHDKEFMGRKLVVSGAKNADQERGESGFAE